MFILAQPGTFVQVEFWQCFNTGLNRVDLWFSPRLYFQHLPATGPTLNMLFDITVPQKAQSMQ